MQTETATKERSDFTALPSELAPKVEEKPRLIDIEKISFKINSSGGEYATIATSENNLYGSGTGSFKAKECGKLRELCDRLHDIFIGECQLKLNWEAAKIRTLNFGYYSYDTEFAQISAILELSIPDGDSDRLLKLDTGSITISDWYLITPIVEEAIALVIAKPKYRQTDLLEVGL